MLTPADREVALARCLQWPGGHGHVYFLGDNPYGIGRPLEEQADKGCPAIAVAANRSDLTLGGIDKAHADLTSACGLEYGFCDLLDFDPQFVAELLRKELV